MSATWSRRCRSPSKTYVLNRKALTRVLQVADQLVRSFVTPLDRVCLRLSDDTEPASRIELAHAVQHVTDSMLQRLAARAARRERSLFPSAKADLQAAFHFLDSAHDAQSMSANCSIFFFFCCCLCWLTHAV